MGIGSSREVARHLRTLYEFGVAGSFTDEQLLARFLASRDAAAEEAFAELVQRHGPMVLGVCRRILGDAHEAEDAFQATFLVLARKASTVVRREKVAGWLHGVAVRTAREARIRSARRRAREERVSMPIHVEPSDDGLPAELREILDEELARLPARHRGPVVLCELEGLPHPEAARRLGIPRGTLSSRLARAKARLRDRLSARGVTLPAAALSALLVREARASTVPLSLFESTVEAATLVAAGPSASAALSASVASLSEGVIKTMFVAKLKGIALAVGTMTVAVSGAVVLAQSGPRPEPKPAIPAAETRAEVRADPDDRTAALERKLDRLLEALERMSRTPSPEPSPRVEPTSATEPTPVERSPREENTRTARFLAEARPALVESVVVGTSNLPTPAVAPEPAPTRANSEPQPGSANNFPLPEGRPSENQGQPRPATPPTRQASLADRLQSLEQQMQQVQNRLDRLEGRLKSLDTRVGGPEIEANSGSPAPRAIP